MIRLLANGSSFNPDLETGSVRPQTGHHRNFRGGRRLGSERGHRFRPPLELFSALFLMNFFTIFSSVIQDVAHFFAQDSAKFRKNPQNSEILSNSLAFREIPKKYMKFAPTKCRVQWKFANFCKNFSKFCEILTKFWKLVRRFAKFLRFSWRILYILKNAAKCAYSRYRGCPYSRERASESPENPRKNVSI